MQASAIKVGFNLRNVSTILFFHISQKNRINEKYHYLQKCKKIKKDSKIHNAKTNKRKDFWLAPLKRKTSSFLAMNTKQGRIYGNPIADGWAGAVMQKPLEIQKCDGWTDGPTY